MVITLTKNKIRIRQKPPGNYIRFRTMPMENGVKAVIGFKSEGGSEVQSYIFDKELFSKKTAAAWVKRHKRKKSKK
jgi:hypothetical protein